MREECLFTGDTEGITEEHGSVVWSMGTGLCFFFKNKVSGCLCGFWKR